MHFTPIKQAAVLITCLIGALLIVPNFFSKETLARWPSWLPSRQLNLGLDLRGGAHLLLSMETGEVRKDWLDTLRDDARRRLREAKIGVTGLGVANNVVQVRLAKAEDADAALKELRGMIQPIGNLLVGSSGHDIEIKKGDGGVITITPTEPGLQQRIGNAIGAAIETVRRRVDSLGTAEAQIVREGRDRILVQVPGLQDTAGLKELIGKTARLTFHEVSRDVSATEARQTRVPPGFKIYESGVRDEGALVLRETPVVRGDELVDAQPAFDSRTNEPVISFRFNNSGARKFGNFTKDHVNLPFAIVLDDKVISAPVIREPILGGSGQISGSFTVETAHQLAIQLRSGALPAKLTIVEERTVGPGLGQDSIAKGKVSSYVGAAMVILFMLVTYGLFGLFANIAVAINVAMIFGVLSMLNATLTLPGIAGIVLTVGIAVDSNVLIYERIREEVRAGRTPINAIDAGFSRALATILDSNITTFIAAAVLFYIGTGPVRGFAVTLGIGIITTVFTAFTLTRLIVAYWVRWRRPQRVPI